MSRLRILREVSEERNEQVRAHGWTEEIDDHHTIPEWVALITRHAGLAVDDGDPAASPAHRFRRQMVRVAALAVAALEAADRREEAARVGQIDAQLPPAEKVAGPVRSGGPHNG